MDSGQGYSSTTQTHSSALVFEPTFGSVSGRMISSGDDTDMRSMTREVVSLRITEIGDDNQALVVHSQGYLSIPSRIFALPVSYITPIHLHLSISSMTRIQDYN